MVFRTVFNTLFLLLRIPCVEGPGGYRRVPTQEGHLLKDENVLHTVFRSRDRRSQACPARTDDDDVRRLIPLLDGLCGRHCRTGYGGSCRRSDGRPEEMSAIEFHSLKVVG